MLSALDPLLSWARDAHLTMGGLNFTRRLRLQGRINKLRAQLEKSTPVKHESRISEKKKKISGYESPPAAPIAVKRRRFIDLNDEGVAGIRRKLSDDFDRVAQEDPKKRFTRTSRNS